MANKRLYVIKEVKELEEKSYRYHRMMTKLSVFRESDDALRFENACLEIGRLQGFEQGIKQATEFMK